MTPDLQVIWGHPYRVQREAGNRHVLVRVWRRGNPSTLLVGKHVGAAARENSAEAPQRIKNRSTIWSSNSTSGYLPEGNEITIWKRNLHLLVLCNIAHNNQDLETTQASISGWIDKEEVGFIQWNIIQPWERKKSCPLWQLGWNVRALC